MSKRKPAYPYTEEWEREVPELTEEQEENVAKILRDLGRTRKAPNEKDELFIWEHPVRCDLEIKDNLADLVEI